MPPISLRADKSAAENDGDTYVNGVRVRVRPDMTAAEIDSFIAGHEWRFAKTMATIPHSYVVKAKCRSAVEFERFAIHIRRHGYEGRFFKARYIYFDWEVGGVVHQFWTMGAPISETIIINRAVKGMNK